METAFDMFKLALITASVFTYSDFIKPSLVPTDASRRAIRPDQSQKDEEGQEISILCPRSGLNDAEKNNSTYEDERQEIMFAFKNFRH